MSESYSHCLSPGPFFLGVCNSQTLSHQSSTHNGIHYSQYQNTNNHRDAAQYPSLAFHKPESVTPVS